MKHVIAYSALILVLFSFSSRNAYGVIAFDQNVTPEVIFGSGNANGSFTVDRTGSLELGLRAKERYPTPSNTFNSNGAGKYTFSTGHSVANPDRPLWNFEWSVNTNYDAVGSDVLSSLTYRIDIDYDPAVGTTNFQSFDLISTDGTFFWDHAIGDNSTGNGGGTSATDILSYTTLVDNNNVAQNSWSLGFFDDGSHVSLPDVGGEYDIVLTAFRAGVPIGSTSIVVAAVPEASQVIGITLVLCTFAATTWLKRSKAVPVTV